MLTILSFIDCSKMAQKRINTRSLNFCKIDKAKKKKKNRVSKICLCMYVSEICGNFCVFSLVTKKMWKVGQKQPFFQMSTILKFDFQKRKQLHFPEENYLNYTKRHNFACDNYIFPKTRANRNKQWTHLGALKVDLLEPLQFVITFNFHK